METRAIQDLLAEVAQRWREDRVEPGTPASNADIAAFEAGYGVQLPPDVRAYFATLNGSRYGSDGDMDDLLLSFWHLSQVRSLAEESNLPVPDVAEAFVFADWSIFAHVYVLRLTPDPENPAPVSVIYDDVAVPVAASFREFLEQYVRRDQEALFPDPPPAWVAKHRDRAV